MRSAFGVVCIVTTALVAQSAQAFDLQGHRGARGTRPENTLPAFERALAIGVTTLETDMAITRDGIIVLTHDPVLNPDLVRDATGAFLKRPGPSIRSLTFAETQVFDVGRLAPATKYAAQWPEQMAIDGTRMPQLSDLFALAARTHPSVRFNLETKLSPLKPAETVDPETFVTTFVREVRRAGVSDRVTLQSFDWRTLLVSKRLAPEIARSCLTIDTPTTSTLRNAVDGTPSPWLGGLDLASGSIVDLVAAAGCTTWSPFWRNLDTAAVVRAHASGLKVVPWTINQPADMATVIALGVDGLITDYPERAHKVLAEKNIEIAR